jgi:hypothetical protein
MRERSYNAPQPAMLARSSGGLKIVAASQGAAAAPRMTSQYPSTAAAPVSMHPVHSKCGCGRGGSCSCGGHHGRSFAPARYDEDGNCASPYDVSCDTQWRIRECFKIAFCDLIRCFGEELCEDGKFKEEPDFGACLEGFLCSLVNCLPEAICPPEKPEFCCTALPEPSWDCNYAVRE